MSDQRLTRAGAEGLRSPKLSRTGARGSVYWYDYYAGYSSGFVQDVLEWMGLQKSSIVLDPWNGVGTTTNMVQQAGLRAVGFDLNPVVSLVAKARTLRTDVRTSLQPLSIDILRLAKGVEPKDGEPLREWLPARPADVLRSFEVAIQQLLISSDQTVRICELQTLDSVSNLAAFYYTALFRTLRDLVRSRRTSNPTWLRRRATACMGEITADSISMLFVKHVAQLAEQLGTVGRDIAECRIDLAHSTDLPLRSASIDGIVTSPPYCTRIDYAVTTAPELALLGLDMSVELKTLRNRMLGTSTIASPVGSIDHDWGPTCARTLDRIGNHQSRAARSYYLKTYMQYFAGLHSSIREIGRVLRPAAHAAFVVQDSYFKDIHVDLATILKEMGTSQALTPKVQVDFPQNRSMRLVNKNARRYRDQVTAVESVIIFQQQ